MRTAIVCFTAAVAAAAIGSAPAAAAAGVRDVSKAPLIRTLIDELVTEQNFDRDWLESVFRGVSTDDRVVAAIRRPAEGLSWAKYRRLFVTGANINAGVEFWRKWEPQLVRAEQQFGVPAAVIVAIIGIETHYGRHTGSYPVLTSLTTLTLDYPRRSDFFRGELKAFLLLSREENFDPASVKGSYAGAMGLSQFIASSYRHYAVDFSGDGRRDLTGSVADAIGSVGNYLAGNGWRAGGGTWTGARGKVAPALVTRELEPATTVAVLAGHGVLPAASLAGSERVGLIRLDGTGGDEYHIARHNFYVITRYNRSVLYASAVTQLADAMRRRMP